MEFKKTYIPEVKFNYEEIKAERLRAADKEFDADGIFEVSGKEFSGIADCATLSQQFNYLLEALGANNLSSEDIIVEFASNNPLKRPRHVESQSEDPSILPHGIDYDTWNQVLK